ncbi:MAG TPA: response regulator [Candidatus Binatia bacterium]|nr:response regulator [Candidatus Binatia bacterium]
MSEPLALLVYEKLLPGGQLVNQLQDRGYRVQPLADPADLTSAAQQKPMLVFMDLEPKTEQVCAAIRRLKTDPSTAHIPVIAIAPHAREELAEPARAAGAKLVVFDNAILVHLDQFLEQALQLD